MDAANCIGLKNLCCNFNSTSSPCIEFPYEKGDLQAAIQMCPFLVDLTIIDSLGSHDTEDQSIFDLDLAALIEFELPHLRHLTFKFLLYTSFSRVILPILQKFGPSLESLHLECLQEIQVGEIIRCCPNLRSLALIACRCIPSNFSGSTRLEHLKHLRMCAMENFYPNADTPRVLSHSAVDLIVLLSNESLVTIAFFNVVAFVDQVFEKAALLHGFPNLQEIKLELCGSFTKNTINRLLALKNPLKKVTIGNCERIHDQHIEVWRRMAILNNWDLEVVCSNERFWKKLWLYHHSPNTFFQLLCSSKSLVFISLYIILRGKGKKCVLNRSRVPTRTRYYREFNSRIRGTAADAAGQRNSN